MAASESFLSRGVPIFQRKRDLFDTSDDERRQSFFPYRPLRFATPCRWEEGRSGSVYNRHENATTILPHVHEDDFEVLSDAV